MVEKAENQGSSAGEGKHSELTSRLENLTTELRRDLGALNPDVVEQILSPLDGLLKDTKDLAELDRVHAELEDKIIQPVRRAQLKASWYAIAFGLLGAIGVIASILGIVSNLNNQAQMSHIITQALEDSDARVRGKISSSPSEHAEVQVANDPSLLLQPRRALAIALATGDSQLSYAAAKQLIDGSYGVEEEVQAVTVAVITGAIQADGLIAEVWNRHKSNISPDQAGSLAGAAVQYYDLRDREEEGEPLVTEVAKYVENHPESSPENRAFMWNQLSKLTSDNDPERARGYQLQAIELDSSDPSYRYNLSIIYEDLQQLDEAIESAEAALARQGGEKDGDYYSQAIDVYIKRLKNLESSGDTSNATQISETEERLRQLFNELEQVDRQLWQVLRLTEERLRHLSTE